MHQCVQVMETWGTMGTIVRCSYGAAPMVQANGSYRLHVGNWLKVVFDKYHVEQNWVTNVGFMEQQRCGAKQHNYKTTGRTASSWSTARARKLKSKDDRRDLVVFVVDSLLVNNQDDATLFYAMRFTVIFKN